MQYWKIFYLNTKIKKVKNFKNKKIIDFKIIFYKILLKKLIYFYEKNLFITYLFGIYF